jgi:hypothetical protein
VVEVGKLRIEVVASSDRRVEMLRVQTITTEENQSQLSIGFPEIGVAEPQEDSLFADTRNGNPSHVREVE